MTIGTKTGMNIKDNKKKDGARLYWLKLRYKGNG
jgi:hypothetical protein